MCGIAGIISRDKVDPRDLHKMASVLRHRGPDDEGFCFFTPEGTCEDLKGNDTIGELGSFPHITEKISENYFLGLAHRRLSIIDLSAAGHQPMHYLDRYTIVFNGEVYNYPEIKKDLESTGATFRTATDTEVIVAAYHHYGKTCVEKFIGMWALAVYDRQEKTLFLSRDRFGIKPLYYFANGTQLAFASEIKALLQLDAVKPEVSLSSAFEYISFGATYSPENALFSQIRTLPPAHNLVIRISAFEHMLERYYDLERSIERVKLPPDEKKPSAFSDLFGNSVHIHLRSDVPVGSTLSGGLDSSTVVALCASQMHGRPFKTFTASYEEAGIDESQFAKKVTDRLPNTESHLVFPKIENYWKDLEKLTWHQDLPISSTSMFAQWEVMKRAKKENTKVLMDGQGADEILGGYYNFAGIYLLELLKHFRFGKFNAEKKALEQNFNPAMQTALGRAAFYFFPEFIQRKIRARKRLGMQFISEKYRPELQHVRVPGRGGKSFKEQSLLSMRYGLQDLLRYEDRNSMAFSIESRVPFLDHRVVEFSIALENEWKIRQGWTKYILRKTADPLLDPEVTWRKDKMGFLTPQKQWKERSVPELKMLVDNCPLPDFIDRNYLANLCSEPLGNATHLSEFWRIVSFIKWAQVFKVKFI